MTNLKEKYNTILKDYNKIIVDTFDVNDFKEYNEILFSAHSCGIEGNSFSVNETRELKEKGVKLKLQNKSLFEAYEILDHFNAYNFLFNNVNEPLTEKLIKKTHKILTKNTISFTKKGSKPGQYTKTQMAAGDTIFGDFKKNIKLVPKLLTETQRVIKEANVHPVEICARFHQYFIYLHPFYDGNGRLGRLISNFILQKFNHPPIIIISADKLIYIDALKRSHKHKNALPIINFFYETAIKRMENEIDQKKNLTQNFHLGLREK